ncbi:MsnO8 family LLM class oxidoreductase [Oceanobacillus chungangensis]|uniref:MsnO8 family LLM class oxidoreductase n=1 Tax=Oceanobacillus chungangensis TaxID=1229152 RepID=UPI002684FEC5
MVPVNILDYVLVDEGENARDALLQTTELAKLADDLGYHRFWVPEQHQAFSIASSSPEMIMIYLAAATKRIRIGSGGVMLPHYSPYKVAENFLTLETFHPNRIDLGIGDSSGGRIINRVLNEEKGERLTYKQQVKDVVRYLSNESPENHRFPTLTATPISETTPEVWMLGAGGESKKIAAENGTAFTFAHFINPAGRGIEIIKTYRHHFQPTFLLLKLLTSILLPLLKNKR